MNYYLFIPFFIILLFFLPVKLEVRLSFNVLEKTGAFGIFVFGKKVDYQQFWIENKKIISKKENEIESHELNIQSREMLYLQMLISEIKDKTRLKEISVFYHLGTGDAFQSAMLGGLINTSLISFMNSIKNAKPTASLGVYDTISYNRKVCQFAVKGVMSISLFDVVYSLLHSVILTKKNENKLKGEEKWNFIHQTKT